MKYLNLDKDFNPFNVEPQDCIDFEVFTFSGGEPHIKIKSFWDDEDSICITIRINKPDDIFILILAMDAVNRVGNYDTCHLFLPYFPGARQDRVMVKGEPLTSKVYADLINDLEFNSVEILDPHSDVVPALLDPCITINNHEFVRSALHDIYDNDGRHNPLIISPDAGSNKKIKDLAKYIHELDGETQINVVKCDKTRDTSTGKIIGFEVYTDDLAGMDCIIVDDICANGGTFLGLVQELKNKNAGDLYLVITHGEFGNDKFETLRRLTNVFKCVYCTDSIFNIDERWFEATKYHKNLDFRNKVKQIKIADIL